jgi:hypothetical protein
MFPPKARRAEPSAAAWQCSPTRAEGCVRSTPPLPADLLTCVLLIQPGLPWSEIIRRSRECLEQAIELDPKFVLPLVGLADHYQALAGVGVMSAHGGMLRARASLQSESWNWIPLCPKLTACWPSSRVFTI